MTDVAAPAPRRGWWWLGWAVLGFVLAPGLPIAHTLLPLDSALLVLVPCLAVCAVVGWWRGGSLPMAVLTSTGAVYAVWMAVRGGVNSQMLSAGWAVIAAGCLGLALLAARSRFFLGSGVVAVLSALLLSAGLVAATPSGPASFQTTVSAALDIRGKADVDNWRIARAQMERQNASRLDSATVALLDAFETSVAGVPQVARVILPAALALQTLVGMAIAWALFHRFSRTRLGEELGRLRDFRFNDHWIWSVIVGLVLALLPALEPLRPLGINLLVFFGALYAMRGTAVLAWFLRPGRSLLGLLVGVALLLLLRDGAAIALGLVGLGDTWADWRRRIRPAVS
jgi:Predicted membrane protein (DUF2232)